MHASIEAIYIVCKGGGKHIKEEARGFANLKHSSRGSMEPAALLACINPPLFPLLYASRGCGCKSRQKAWYSCC
jgi:hypothetical protein